MNPTGAGTGTRTKSLLEIMQPRTCTRTHSYDERRITSPSRSVEV
jgi:hypothetical protein